MNVRRDMEFTDGWFPEGVDIVPDLTAPLIAAMAVVLLIAVAAAAGVLSLGRRR